jgi:hypothetical protein
VVWVHHSMHPKEAYTFFSYLHDHRYPRDICYDFMFAIDNSYYRMASRVLAVKPAPVVRTMRWGPDASGKIQYLLLVAAPICSGRPFQVGSNPRDVFSDSSLYVMLAKSSTTYGSNLDEFDGYVSYFYCTATP